jgi:hypothetical protein
MGQIFLFIMGIICLYILFTLSMVLTFFVYDAITYGIGRRKK